MWGRTVVVPDSLKEQVLQEQHKEHLGITKMKAVAQDHVWQAGIDKDVDTLNKLEVMLGSYFTKCYFVVVDTHSKQAEVTEMPQTTTANNKKQVL